MLTARLRTVWQIARRTAGSVLAALLAACSGGDSGGGSPPPLDFRFVGVVPTEGAWVSPDIVPEVSFSRPLVQVTTRPGDLALFRRGGAAVPGQVKVEGARLMFQPADPLAEGFYVLVPGNDIKAFDGSPLATVALTPVEFSVRGSAGIWSDAVSLGDAPPVDVQPLIVTDAMGNASAAWVRGNQVLVADYDRDLGWSPAVVVDRIVGAVPATVLLARGAATVAVAIVQAEGGVSVDTTIRVRVSRGLDRQGARVWEAPQLVRQTLVTAPQLHVSVVGQPFLLSASTLVGRTELRVLWLDAVGWRDEAVGRVASQFSIDGVYHGMRGDLMITWTETTLSDRVSYARVRRAAGWNLALTLGEAPRAAGIGADGNAWLLLPDGLTRAIYIAQDAERWLPTRPSVPAGFDHLIGLNRDLLQLSWRADLGAEILMARRYDRLGQLIAENVLAGPTPEPLRHVLLAGDLDTEVTAIWREGQGIQVARLARRGSPTMEWSPAVAWQAEHAQIPIERARITAASRRTALTWVEDGRLATSFLVAGRLAARRAITSRVSMSPTPLLDEVLVGTALGDVLVVWRQNGALLGQSLR